MKKLPPQMRDWYFPFNWDLDKLWALDLKPEIRDISELRWHFDIPIWSVSKGMHFDLYPREVIETPGKHPRHDDRIQRSDISFPIDMMFTVDRFAILDGVHRLAKYEIQGLEKVSVRIIPQKMATIFAEGKNA